MAQQLGVLAALLEDPDSWIRFPAPTWQLTTVCDSSSRGSDTLTQTCMLAKHQCTENKGKEIINFKKEKEKSQMWWHASTILKLLGRDGWERQENYLEVQGTPGLNMQPSSKNH